MSDQIIPATPVVNERLIAATSLLTIVDYLVHKAFNDAITPEIDAAEDPLASVIRFLSGDLPPAAANLTKAGAAVRDAGALLLGLSVLGDDLPDDDNDLPDDQLALVDYAGQRVQSLTTEIVQRAGALIGVGLPIAE